ncbi:hypothetical protein D6D13_08394 [Aureobasidium pullulans]|uniref:Uncharacterized protein n=1 Tax=Aureobasidium pullulans TaxID=5580 RepID=A0A4S9C9L1_AURPU|nr:hypothetical protein D6D13_08394 [Aureobasidium pullulans]
MVHLTAPILLLASLCLLLLTTPTLADTEFDFQNHRYKCQRKSGAIMDAIARHCRKDLHMPTGIARLGESFDGGTMSFPSPQNPLAGWMVVLMIRLGDSRGRGTQIFGGKGCQMFTITDFKKY